MQWTLISMGQSNLWSSTGVLIGTLVYVNDISVNLVTPTRLFADDCIIYRQVSNTDDCVTLQEDLARLHAWAQRWQLALNLKPFAYQTKIDHHNTYRMTNVALQSVNPFKYLGVRLDSKLKWGAHDAGCSGSISRYMVSFNTALL